MKTNILVEHLTSSEGNIITESVNGTNGGKNVYLSGIVMQADIQNRNGRIYPMNEMAKAVSSMNENIKTYGGIFGELDHPADRISVNLDRVSHVITEVYMNGANVMGKMKILDTPVGLIAKVLAESGVRYGVSSRGTGLVNEGVVSNFNLQTIDLVAHPSGPDCTPDTIYEGLQELSSGRNIISLSEALREDNDAQKYISNAVLTFIKELTTKKIY